MLTSVDTSVRSLWTLISNNHTVTDRQVHMTSTFCCFTSPFFPIFPGKVFNSFLNNSFLQVVHTLLQVFSTRRL